MLASAFSPRLGRGTQPSHAHGRTGALEPLSDPDEVISAISLHGGYAVADQGAFVNREPKSKWIVVLQSKRPHVEGRSAITPYLLAGSRLPYGGCTPPGLPARNAARPGRSPFSISSSIAPPPVETCPI